MRAILAIFAVLVAVAVFFIALATSPERTRTCAQVIRGKHAARAITSPELGRGLSCREVRGAIVRWMADQYPLDAAGWRFAYHPGCSCHSASRRRGTRRQSFRFQ